MRTGKEKLRLVPASVFAVVDWTPSYVFTTSGSIAAGTETYLAWNASWLTNGKFGNAFPTGCSKGAFSGGGCIGPRPPPLRPVTVYFGNFVMLQRLACLIASWLHASALETQLHIVYLLILAPCGRGSDVIYFRLMTSKTQNFKKCQRDHRRNVDWVFGRSSDKRQPRQGSSFCCLRRSCFCQRNYKKHPICLKDSDNKPYLFLMMMMMTRDISRIWKVGGCKIKVGRISSRSENFFSAPPKWGANTTPWGGANTPVFDID